MNLLEIMPALEKPFPIDEIDFLPKSQFERNEQTLCVGLPFADPRTYQDRLNAVCPGEWSTQASVTVAGNKVLTLVTVTVCGVPHTDIGEAFLTGSVRGEIKDEENTGTESFAQAFKRACSQFGLGRYLYSLEKAYIPWDKQRKRFDVDQAEKRRFVVDIYKKAGLLDTKSYAVASDAGKATEKKQQDSDHKLSALPENQPVSEQIPATAPTVMSLFEKGKSAELWEDSDDFYAVVSSLLEREVTRSTARSITPEERTRIDREIKQDIARKRAQSSEVTSTAA